MYKDNVLPLLQRGGRPTNPSWTIGCRCVTRNTEVQFRNVHDSWWKGYIRRFFKTCLHCRMFGTNFTSLQKIYSMCSTCMYPFSKKIRLVMNLMIISNKHIQGTSSGNLPISNAIDQRGHLKVPVLPWVSRPRCKLHIQNSLHWKHRLKLPTIEKY